MPARNVEKIFHVDHLPEHMKVVLKTVMDYSLYDIAELYGLTYLTPRLGEPIFIPFGYLTGKFKDHEEAYEHLMNEIEERKQEGYKKYAEWYPGYEFLDYFRIVFYSYVDRAEGVIYGVGAEPLALPPKERVQIPDELVQGSVLASPVFLHQALKGKGVLYDPVRKRWGEVREAYIWLYRDFHLNFDKDRAHADEVAKFLVDKFFQNLERVLGRAKTTESLKGERVVVYVPKVRKTASSSNLIEAIKEAYSEELATGRHYEVTLKDFLQGPKAVEEVVYQATGTAKELVAVFDEKVDLNSCKYCPEVLKSLKLKSDLGNVKVFQLGV